MNVSFKRMNSCLKVEGVKEKERMISLLDLPEPILENISSRLSPLDLCSMVQVCSYLREMCSSDHLWEKQLKRKWGKVIGDVAFREWKSQAASNNVVPITISKDEKRKDEKKKKGLLESLRHIARPLSWIRPKMERTSRATATSPDDSIMAFYVSLESGKFWFPAQIYYGEHFCRGDMLLCYDSHVRYDSRTNTFEARYPSQGWGRSEEANIKWDRLRAQKVDTPPYMVHVSDCLDDLKPGDHIEIQWTCHKELPYGWWYALIGHLESCGGSQIDCSCQYSEKIVVEFNQYPPGSRWRRTLINRKYHPEEGNSLDGFYGGIIKLCDEEEISKWLGFWPNYDRDDDIVYF